MKTFRTFAPLLALALAISAHADTLFLGSYGTTASNPGFSNSATSYISSASVVDNGSTATYNLTPDGTWHAAIANSTYVSYDPNTAPGGSLVTPFGAYVYTSSFFLTEDQAAQGIGSISVLADDTVAVYLNNNLLLAAGGPQNAMNPYTTCSNIGPNCLTPTTVNLSGLVSGKNTLTFDVQQVNGANEGLDYAGAIISSVPEPSTLALASTGLLGLAGLVRRRFKA